MSTEPAPWAEVHGPLHGALEMPPWLSPWTGRLTAPGSARRGAPSLGSILARLPCRGASTRLPDRLPPALRPFPIPLCSPIWARGAPDPARPPSAPRHLSLLPSPRREMLKQGLPMATESRPGSLQGAQNCHDLAGFSSLPQTRGTPVRAPSCHRLFAPAAPEGGSFPTTFKLPLSSEYPLRAACPLFLRDSPALAPLRRCSAPGRQGFCWGSTVMVGPVPSAPRGSVETLRTVHDPQRSPHGPDQPREGQPAEGCRA